MSNENGIDPKKLNEMKVKILRVSSEIFTFSGVKRRFEFYVNTPIITSVAKKGF